MARKLKPIFEEKAKENQNTHTKQGYQKSDKAVDTKKELAKIAGVSHDTIHKVEVIENKGVLLMKYYTANQIAELLNVHPTTIKREYERGKLNGFLVGNELRISSQDFDDYSYIKERQKTSHEIQLENEIESLKLRIKTKTDII